MLMLIVIEILLMWPPILRMSSKLVRHIVAVIYLSLTKLDAREMGVQKGKI